MRLALLTSLCGTLILFAAASCSDDEDDGGGTGGAGAATTDASTGGGTGGSGGLSGSGGVVGGAAGIGGAVGGAAGMDSGLGGSAGQAGDGSSEAGPQLSMCIDTCVVDTDCDDGSVDPFVCDQNKRCRQLDAYSEYCKVDSDCIPQASSWSLACKSTADCPSASQVCVDVGGGIGKCAPKQGAPFCIIAPDEFSMPELGGDGGTVTVYGDQDGMKCHPTLSYCVATCQTNTDCPPSGETKSCVSGGMCGCSQNSECASGFCDTRSGQCGCTKSTDCPAANPVCIGGTCGCGSVNDCSSPFANTTLSCG